MPVALAERYHVPEAHVERQSVGKVPCKKVGQPLDLIVGLSALYSDRLFFLLRKTGKYLLLLFHTLAKQLLYRRIKSPPRSKKEDKTEIKRRHRENQERGKIMRVTHLTLK
jgi:hypothetical protein